MKIELINVTVKELTDGYKDSEEEGVVAYGGRLNVRPKYQREFVYDNDKRDAVIRTVKNGFPLNVMYWAKNDDGTYEILDGQQRTISLCRYVAHDFSVDGKYIDWQGKGTQDPKVMLYDKLMIYVCEGNYDEKLDWFQVINIAGVKLSDQELRNATFTGEWLTDAKRHFSKSYCAAYGLSEGYVNCKVNRQELLELALKWITGSKEDKAIRQYMADHQHDMNANELWLYFQNVMAWVKTIFPKYRKEMKGLPWGEYYNEHGHRNLDTKAINEEIDRLMVDGDVTDHKGIYAYVLDRKEKHLNLRAFDDDVKRIVYERQKGICPDCHEHFEIDEMEADHVVPWHMGGKTTIENCEMRCRSCNRIKSGKLTVNMPTAETKE